MVIAIAAITYYALGWKKTLHHVIHNVGLDAVKEPSDLENSLQNDLILNTGVGIFEKIPAT